MHRPRNSRVDLSAHGAGNGAVPVKPGTFAPDDVKDGAFAQFADARTLVEHKRVLVSRDVHAALPAIYCFTRQLGSRRHGIP